MSPVLVALGMLAVLAAVDQLLFGDFITPALVGSLLADTCFLLPLAIGETFVVLTGGLDLSIGSVVGFGGMIAAALIADGLPVAVVVPVVVLAGTAVGGLNAALVAAFRMPPFVATLGSMFLLRGLAYVVRLHSIPIHDAAFDGISREIVGLGDLRLSIATVFGLLIAAAAVLLLNRTRLGRTIYAVGGDFQAARLMGLPATRSLSVAYVLSGTCAGVAAVVFAAYTSSGDPRAGVGMELQAIAAVVIGGALLNGGVGSAVGTVVGVLVTGLIQITVNALGIASWWTVIIVGTLLLVFVLAQRFARPGSGRDRA